MEVWMPRTAFIRIQFGRGANRWKCYKNAKKMMKMLQNWLFFDDFVAFCYNFIGFTSKMDPFPPYLHLGCQKWTKSNQNGHKSSKYCQISSKYVQILPKCCDLRPKWTPFPHICIWPHKMNTKSPIWVVYMQFWDEFGYFCVILCKFTSILTLLSPYLRTSTQKSLKTPLLPPIYAI